MEYEAGRELDALIAEKIMELSTEHLAPVWQEGTTKDGKDGWDGFYCPRCGQPSIHADGMIDGVCAEYYSTDIAAAWQVVEKMRERFHIVTLSSDKSLGAREWHFHLANYPYPHDKKNEFDGFGDTAPLAICRTVMEIDDA